MTPSPTPAPDAAEIEALIPKLETLRLHLRDGLDHDADAELVAVAIAALRSLSRPVEVTDAMVERAAAAYWYEVYGSYRPGRDKWPDDVTVWSQDLFRRACRAALTAALGGRDNG